MPSKQLHIGILGAGPGGLTLARILQQNGIKCTVFEREESADVRSQGGSLDLHPHSGQKALLAANLLEKAKTLFRYEGQDTKVLDIKGNVFISTDEADRDRPEIDRRVLRNLLLESVESGTIQWNHNLQRITEQNGSYELFFQNFTVKSDFDLIVGADGAWSKARLVLSEQKPLYSGVNSVALSVSNIQERFPDLYSLIGRGMAMALAPRQGMLLQQNGDKCARSYVCIKAPEDWIKTCGIDFSTAQSSREGLLSSVCQDWGEGFKDFIRNSDDEIVARALYELPVGYKWEHKSGITLIGDAAHLMTPFAGQGVNLAMADALELAEAIIQNQENLDEGVRKFEESMFVRAAKAAGRTRSNLDIMFDENAPMGIVNFFKSMLPPTQPQQR